MFNYFKLLNLFRENRMVWKEARVRKGAVVQQPSQKQRTGERTGEEAAPEGGKEAGKEGTKEKKEKVLDKSKRGKTDLKTDVQKQMTKKASQEEREKFKESVKDISGIDRLRLNRLRKLNNIDPSTLDPSTEVGLAHVVDVFKNKLALAPGDVDWMEGQLKYAFDENIWKSKSNAERLLFQDPEKNLDAIRSKNEFFALAYTYFLTVKKVLQEQSGFEKSRIKAQEAKDPILTFVTDNLSQAGTKFMTAVEEHDWMTVGLYAATAGAFYKLFGNKVKSLFSGGDKGSMVGKFLLYGTATYGFLSIFAPNTVKKIWGKGVNTDIKNTAWENLDKISKENPDAYTKGLDAALMGTLSAARVRDVFAPITPGNSGFDAKSARAGMIQLTNPGIARYINDPELVKMGPINLDDRPISSLSAKQRAYIKICEQLYASALGLKKVWEKNLYSKEGVTFEERFMGDHSQDYTMEELADQLSAFYTSERVSFWDPTLLEQARKDLSSDAGSNALFKRSDALHVYDQDVQGERLEATVFGFPIVIKLNQNTVSAEKEYRFYLASESGEGTDPIATYVSGSTGSIESVRDDVKSSIETKMKDLLQNLAVDGRKGLDSFDFVDGKWQAKIKVKGVPKFNIPAREITVEAEVRPGGKRLILHSPDSRTPIIVDEEMEKQYEYSSLVLNKLLAQKEFNALNVLAEDGRVEFQDIEGDPKCFNLIVAGHSLKCSYDNEKDVFAVEDKEAERALVKDPDFIGIYIETLEKQKFGVFDKIKEFAKRMPQSYFLYFFQGMTSWVSAPKIDSWFNPNADCIGGSIPNYYAYMLVDSKRDALKYQLSFAMSQNSTLEGIEPAKKQVSHFLSDINGYYERIKDLKTPENWESWPRNDFLLKVVEPLKEAGIRSREYSFAVRRFENSMFTRLGSRGSDVSDSLHLVSGKLMGTFYYFTSHLDSSDLDNYSTDSSKRNAILHANYFKYVEDNVLDLTEEYTRSSGVSPDNIPSPEVFAKEIKQFDAWEKGIQENELLAMPEGDPLSNDIDPKNPNQRSPLEDVLAKKYEQIIDDIATYGSGLDIPKLQQWGAYHLGYARGYKTGALRPFKERGVWNEAAAIASNSRNLTEQYGGIERCASTFLDNILTDNDLWVDLTFMDWVRKNWRKLTKLN